MQGAIVPPSERDIVQLSSLSPYLWFIAMVAALGGLLFGYDWVVIGGAREFYEVWFHLTSSSLVGWANSCALLGCLAGSLLSGWFGDWLGRRKMLIVAAVLFGISSLATGLAPSFSSFILWRIIGGVAIGLASAVAPIYIAEISPAAYRGRLVSLNQFAIVIGILLAQVVNALIARSESGVGAAMAHQWNVTTGWRWMFIAVAFPAGLFFIGALFLPESPRWLIAHGKTESAQKIMRHIFGSDGADRETAEIVARLEDEQGRKPGWGQFVRPGFRKPLLLAIAIAILQQWTGINILFNYASEVYRSAGFRASDILLDIVITGSINLLATVLAMALVDTLGRKRLMLVGCLGIGISHTLCALAYREHWPGMTVLLLTLAAIACYACTLAPVTWVFISEVFPMGVRSRGMSLAGSALWIASFLLTYTFPVLQHRIGIEGTFLLYAGVCFSGFLLVFTQIRETRGIALERVGQ